MGRDIAYDNGVWIAVGESPEKNILWSPDGRTWNDASSGGFVNIGLGVASTRNLSPLP
jgi:hypothetical protein